jgi:hypothetical protein
MGWRDAFIEHGKPEILRELHGLTAANAAAKVLACCLKTEDVETEDRRPEQVTG